MPPRRWFSTRRAAASGENPRQTRILPALVVAPWLQTTRKIPAPWIGISPFRIWTARSACQTIEDARKALVANLAADVLGGVPVAQLNRRVPAESVQVIGIEFWRSSLGDDRQAEAKRKLRVKLVATDT